MRRWLVSLMLCLGLLAGALHAPAMAMPPERAMAAMTAADDVHADCHAGAAEDENDREDPGCCPDGCLGGCLLAGALFELPGIDKPLPSPSAFLPARMAHPAPDPGGDTFHPPRSFA
jgi:hypothetical protein